MNITEIDICESYLKGSCPCLPNGLAVRPLTPNFSSYITIGIPNVFKSLINSVLLTFIVPGYVTKKKYDSKIQDISNPHIGNKIYVLGLSIAWFFISVLFISCIGFYFFVCLIYRVFYKDDQLKEIEMGSTTDVKSTEIKDDTKSVQIDLQLYTKAKPILTKKESQAEKKQENGNKKFEQLVRETLPPLGTTGYELFADPIIYPDEIDEKVKYLDATTYVNGVGVEEDLDAIDEKFYPFQDFYDKHQEYFQNTPYITQFQLVAIQQARLQKTRVPNQLALEELYRKIKMTLSNGVVISFKIFRAEYENRAFTNAKCLK